MNRIVSWFYGKPKVPQSAVSREEWIQSLIVQKQIDEFISCLRRKDDRQLCLKSFFHLLPAILDDRYMSSVFEIILQNARLTPNEISALIIAQLSSAILGKDFDLCERILRLPMPSLRTFLPTYVFVRFIHTCPNPTQLTECLAVLIEKHLPHDSKYLIWIMIVLLEHFVAGDEVFLEYFLNIKDHVRLLFQCYDHCKITPLMLLFHFYADEKCQILIDRCLSNITDPSLFQQCDRWDRSYLTHLLAGQCRHSSLQTSIDINVPVIDRCPHAKTIRSRFSMLHKLGTKCDISTKMIFTSQYCPALQVTILDYLLENEAAFSLDCRELFSNFPPTSIPIYSTYLKELVRKKNLNSALHTAILNQPDHSCANDCTIKFLLQQGAQIDHMSSLHPALVNLISNRQSIAALTLIDYGIYTDIPFEKWSSGHSLRESLYIYRLLQCGYPTEFRTKFEEFKTYLLQWMNYPSEKFLDLKVPTSLSRLCVRKIRCSLPNLGDETIEQLTDHLPNHLKQSITHLGYGECPLFFRSVFPSV